MSDDDRVIETVAVLAGSTYPDRAAWADEYVRAQASDADAVAAFGPRDGR